MTAAKTVYQCRETAAEMFDCRPEQVVFTANCTHGLNLAIHSLVRSGSRVAISGFEHNAVTRPLHARKVQTVVAGRKLFDQEDTLSRFEDALKSGVSAAVVTHCSNVFGYILPPVRRSVYRGCGAVCRCASGQPERFGGRVYRNARP